MTAGGSFGKPDVGAILFRMADDDGRTVNLQHKLFVGEVTVAVLDFKA